MVSDRVVGDGLTAVVVAQTTLEGHRFVPCLAGLRPPVVWRRAPVEARSRRSRIATSSPETIWCGAADGVGEGASLAVGVGRQNLRDSRLTTP